MTRSRIASWVASVYAAIAVALFAAGVPLGWLSPFAVVAVTARVLAVRWRKAARRDVLLWWVSEAEKNALDGKASLAGVVDAVPPPRLELPR